MKAEALQVAFRPNSGPAWRGVGDGGWGGRESDYPREFWKKKKRKEKQTIRRKAKEAKEDGREEKGR